MLDIDNLTIDHPSLVFTLRGCPIGDGRQRPRLSLPYEPGPGQQRTKKMEAGSSQTLTLKKNKGKKVGPVGDSLYYCGVQARISQFVLSEANRNRTAVQKSIRCRDDWCHYKSKQSY